MYRYQLKYIFFFLFIVSSYYTFAQTSTISNPLSGRLNLPYSRFGIGEFWNGNNTTLKGMANINSAYEDPYSTNMDNPASLSFLKYTTYEAGADFENHSLSTNTLSYNTGTSTVSYVNIAIPTSKHFAFSLGLRPMTHVYYSLADTSRSGNDTLIGNEVIHSYTGAGSTNYLYLGASGQYKGLSLGITVGYMFGNVTTIDRLINNDTTASYNSTFEQIDKLGGIYWKAGLIYEKELNRNYKIRVGSTFAMQQSLNEWRNEYWVASYSLADSFIADTTYSSTQAKGTIVLPTTFSIGVQLAHGAQWMVGVDYTTTQWNQFRNMGQKDSVAESTSRFSFGGQFTPNAAALRSFWSRVTYRMGFYYGTNYVYLRNTSQENFGFTMGASLPFSRSTDRIQFALDYGRLGTTANGLITDTYFKFSVGVSFNDKWFVRHPYE